jgi:hypothetical protein
MQQRIDSLAQQVEHNTFNVGVLGSSPRRITQKKAIILKKVIAFFIFAQMVPDEVGSVVILGGLTFVNFSLCIHLC